MLEKTEQSKIKRTCESVATTTFKLAPDSVIVIIGN
jgi:hypothetical protein